MYHCKQRIFDGLFKPSGARNYDCRLLLLQQIAFTFTNAELLGWKNVASQQQIQRATMVFKSLHGLAADYLCSKFGRRETAYNLRDPEMRIS